MTVEELIGQEQWVRVEVAEGRAYTYRSYLEPPLAPGEKVRLPGNVVRADPFVGAVLRILNGPDPGYAGPYKMILGRA